MLFNNSRTYKYTFICFIALSQVLAPIEAFAHNLTISGKVNNFKNIDASPIIRAYLPGLPYYDEVKNNWELLATTKYDTNTGNYNISVNVANNIKHVVLSVAYSSPEIDVISWVKTTNTSDIIKNINIPNKNNKETSLKINILMNEKKFDYISNIASCMLITKGVSQNGRLALLGVYDAWLHNFEVNNLPAGNYRVACSIQNTSKATMNNKTPAILKKYKDIVIPSNTNKVTVNFDFSKSSNDGVAY